ncbi:hypothetical protein LCGC14_2540200, partial [marine sediment metagenome]
DRFTGIPFSKGPRVNLEKDGVKKKFVTQETVDAAWADGWHEPGRPETADAINGHDDSFDTMDHKHLQDACEDQGVEYDKRWGESKLRIALRAQFQGDD